MTDGLVSAMQNDRADERKLCEQQGESLYEIKYCSREINNGGCRLPASSPQQRLWFLDKIQGSSTEYHLGIWLRLRGHLSTDALRSALAALVMRHESLRTKFLTVDGELLQEVSLDGTCDLKIDDLRELGAFDREARIRLIKHEEIVAPFELGVGPLIRSRLVAVTDREHVLLITMHHIISDGWSLGIIQRELSEFYAAHLAGRRNDLAPLPFQYADYVQWQRQWLRGERFDAQLEYWRNRLANAPACLEIPPTRPRPASPSRRGAYVAVEIDRGLTERLKQFARRHRISLFMVLLGSWAILLSKLCGEEDIVIGTPLANRQHPGVEGLVGFFVNMLPLRLSVGGERRLGEFFEQVRDVALEAYENQEFPFEKIVDLIQPERRLDRHPIFQVAMAFDNTPVSHMTMEGLELSSEDMGDETTKFDLLMALEDTAGEIRGVVNYSTDLFDRDIVERWSNCFEVLLRDVVGHNAVNRIEDFSILSDAELRTVLKEFNPAQTHVQENLIQELIEAQVRLRPEAIAVTYEQDSLTYAELNGRANQLARYLRERGVGPEVLVGLCVERSLEMVIGLLGILKAGGAYVPLDPGYPPERLAFMLGDAAPAVVLTQEHLKEGLPPSDADVIALDRAWSEIGAHAADDLAAEAVGLRPDHLAYVIYTSGSTGRPKGAMNEHRAVANRLLWMQEQYRLGEQDRVLQKTPFSFVVDRIAETPASFCPSAAVPHPVGRRVLWKTPAI